MIKRILAVFLTLVLMLSCVAMADEPACECPDGVHVVGCEFYEEPAEETEEEEVTEEAEEEAEEEETEEPALPEALAELQARIDALPEAEALAELGEEEYAAVVAEYDAVMELVFALSDEEFELLNSDKLLAYVDMFSEVAVMALDNVPLPTAGYTRRDGTTVTMGTSDNMDPHIPVTFTFGAQYRIEETSAEMTAAQLEKYGEWYTDFFISVDKTITVDGAIAGEYGDYGWLGMEFEDLTLNAGVEVPIVAEGMGLELNYEFIYELVKVFNCGIFIENKEEIAANGGCTISLELRMTEPSGKRHNIKTAYFCIHSYEYVYNNDATCTADGTETKVCSLCGDRDKSSTRTAVGSSKGHLFSDYIDDNNATCTENGTKTSSCQRCSAKVIMIIKDSALGHDYQPDLENSRPATCTEPGKEVTTCTRCGETFYKATPMVEHDVVDLPAVEPTCTSTGLTLGAKCGVCGKNLVLQEEIPMLEHTYENIPAVEPTYTKPGYTAGVKCAVCGALLSGCEEISVLTPRLSGQALMRKGASQESGIYFPLLQTSQSFSIIGEMENYFYPIMLVNGTTGYLHYSYVA